MKLSFSLLLILTASVFAGAQTPAASPSPLPATGPTLTTIPTAPAPESETYTSASDRFTINLPKKPSSEKEIKAGEMFGVALGKRYDWGLKDAKVTVARMSFDEPMRREADFLDFADAMKRNLLQIYSAKVESERIDKAATPYRLSEVFAAAGNGRLILTRWFVSNTEYYEVSIALKKNTPEDKANGLAVLDSFKIGDASAELKPVQ